MVTGRPLPGGARSTRYRHHRWARSRAVGLPGKLFSSFHTYMTRPQPKC